MIKPFYISEKLKSLQEAERIEVLLENFIDYQLTHNNFQITITPLALTCSIEPIRKVIEKYRQAGWDVTTDMEFYSFVWQTVYNFLPTKTK